MSLEKLDFPPGIVKTNSDYAEAGRYNDAQWVRFLASRPQKMGGFVRAGAGQLDGICRKMLPWRDNAGADRVAYATNTNLYVEQSGMLSDITPLRPRRTGTLSGALTTAFGSAAVTVAHTAHAQKVGDWVTLTASSEVGGLAIAGNYVVKTAPTADSYTVDAGATANASESGGGSLAYVYFRLALANNPFATTSGSSLVTVSDTNHLCAAGDTAIYAGASTVAGLTIDGGYKVVSVVGSNSYTIDAGATASATTAGGGAAVTTQNLIGIGRQSEEAGAGYGLGTYGSGSYGTARSGDAVFDLRNWALQAYGEWLLANPRGGGLYQWDPTIGGRAIGLYNAPAEMLSFFVTEERYIVSLGKDGDALLIGWPDQLDPTNWTPSLGNTADSGRHIQGGNFIQAGSQVRNQTSLIWTDTAAFLHQWRADDLIFTTTRIGDKVGLIGPNAWTVLGEVAYWVGDGLFWKWDGTISELPSDDIRQWVFANLDRDQKSKIVMGTIASKGELIVLYQETGQGEINRYLLCQPNNPGGPIWATGSVVRTAWTDQGLLSNPRGADAAGIVWNHEIGVDGNGAPIEVYIEAAPLDVMEGEFNLDVFGFIPDIKDQAGDLSLYVLTRDRPADTPESDGPYTVTTAGATIDLRSSGAMVGFRLESNALGGNFRIGDNRVDVQKAGVRRS